MEDVSRRGLLSFFVGIGGAAVVGAQPVVSAEQLSAQPAIPLTKSFNWARMELLRRGLIGEIGEDRYDSWFKALEVETFEGGVLVASVPVRFLKRWIEEHYMTPLLRAAQRADPSVEQVVLFVRKPSNLGKRPSLGNPGTSA